MSQSFSEKPWASDESKFFEQVLKKFLIYSLSRISLAIDRFGKALIQVSFKQN